MSEKDVLKKLNLGCGKRPIPGFINLDKMGGPGVDFVWDLETLKTAPLPFPENYFDRILMHHVFEHISDHMGLMHDLWRVAKPGCEMVVVTPYGSSDNAWEDPTHLRPIFKETYIYFTPLAYGGANYGVTCDWDYRRREFRLDGTFFEDTVDEVQIGRAVANLRNVVTEFVAVLVAVKPARDIATQLEPQKPPFTSFKMV